MRNLFTLLALIAITSSQALAQQTVKGKWYTPEQLEMGEKVFEKKTV